MSDWAADLDPGEAVLWKGAPDRGIVFYLTLGRFLMDRLRRRRTRYAVTDRRALIRSGIFSPRLVSPPITAALAIAISGGVRKTLRFGPQEGWAALHEQVFAALGWARVDAFERIEAGETVYRLIRDLQEGRR